MVILLTFSCKNEKAKSNIAEKKATVIKQPDCEITSPITNTELTNNSIRIFFNKERKNEDLKSIKAGRLFQSFGKKLFCNEIEVNNLSSSTYYKTTDLDNEIYEFHFKKGQSQISFNNIKNELIRSADRQNTSNDEFNEFFDFMKRGLAFLLDIKNDAVIIIEYNLFISPKSHEKMRLFLDKYKNSFNGILFSEGNTKIKIIK